ncbi:MAG: dihydropteroate synthase [Verrucomicrobiae bacterium]|nr:dihydropteroate synthase [Verrucomicrobiae bacterium]
MLDLEFLRQLHDRHEDCLKARVETFSLGGTHFDFATRTHLMGVVNLSADSWYRESVCLDVESAIARGLVLGAQGADLVDLGAESTLEKAARVEGQEQNGKLLPVIRALSGEGVKVSVETYLPSVTEACLKAGAVVLNLTGNEHLEEHFRRVAEHEAGVILCYVQGSHVRDVGDFRFAADIVGDMHDYFARRIDLAAKCGVRKIFIDPGLGFYYRNLQDSSRRVAHQMEVFLNTFRLRTLGWPTCHALPHAFEYFGEEVRCAEPFMAVLALLGKTDLLRTHEIPRVRAVARTLAVFPGGSR